MDATYAGELGVNVGDLLLAQPASGEEALESADIFVRTVRLAPLLTLLDPSALGSGRCDLVRLT